MKKIFFIILILCLLPAFGFMLILFKSPNPFDASLKTIEIPQNYADRQIAGLLLKEKLISNLNEFWLVSKILGYSSKLQAGQYGFSRNMSLFQIMTALGQGKTYLRQVKLTVPEGLSVYKITELLNQARLPAAADFYTKALTWEGYLFPDTYFIAENTQTDKLLALMRSRFQQVVLPVWNAAGSTKYSLAEIITLASIIEKEAHKHKERPIISSVFHNRLKAGIALRADPTVKYALEKPGKLVTYNDLKVRSPYNTYLYRGLPPGPICNPGLDSIKAALYPAKTDYLYFVARKDGSHVFSKTFEEHQRARLKVQSQK